MGHFDPFAVLGLERRFDLDAAQVERAYLERVAGMHPDAMAAEALGALGDDGMDAERQSSELNEARRIVADPEQRAIALWRLLGGVEDKTLSPAFLMEMMSVREEMEGPGTRGDRAKWDAWTVERRAEYQRRVQEFFTKIAGGSPAAAVLRQIRLELNAWRYIERMAEQIA